MRERLQRFMVGRYGTDGLNRFLLAVAFAAVVLSMITDIHGFYTLGILAIVLCYVRMLSRNHTARYREAQIYNRYAIKVKGLIRPSAAQKQERKLYHIYRCPNCRQKIRIPRGKGKICVRCPKCSQEFVKRS